MTGGISTGLSDDISRSVEVLKEDGSPWCSLPDLPDSRMDHTQSGLITCGGYSNSDSCLIFESGQWRRAWSLRVDRLYHTAWHTNDTVILLGGTYQGFTTESLQFNGETLEAFTLNYDTESVFVLLPFLEMISFHVKVCLCD